MANQILMHAVSQGDVEQAQSIIVEGGADVNCMNTLGETACHYAALRGSVTMLEVLLAYGADPNVNTKKEYGAATPILLATKQGHIQVCVLTVGRLALCSTQLVAVYGPPRLARAVSLAGSLVCPCPRRTLEGGEGVPRPPLGWQFNPPHAPSVCQAGRS